MRYRPLGRTGQFVSEICLGTMTFHGGAGMWRAIGTLDQSAATALVARALEVGVNFIDTADVYSEGQSEVLLGQALAGGFLSGKFTREGVKSNDARRVTFDFPPVDKERGYDIIDAMRPIAEAHGVSVARVALAWLLSRKGVMSVIVGAKTPEQLDDNLAASDLKLSAEEFATLDRVSALKPEYPGWMLERQAQGRAPA